MLRANRPATPGAAPAPAAPQAVGAAPAPQYSAPAPQAAPAPAPAPAPVQPQYSAPAPAQPQYSAPAPQAAPAPAPAPAPVQPQYTPAPAPQYNTQAPAVQNNGANVANMNAGILDNVDDIGNIGNYVTVDGSDFFYKSSERRVNYIDINVHYGKRYYQWVDETNPNAKQYHNSDTKLDDRYKLKFEVRWYEPGEEGEEPTEFIHSMSTTSAIQFLDYLKKLASAGIGVGQVWTRMTISRHDNTHRKGERYSRVDFEAFDLQTGQPLNIKSNA